MWGGGGCRTPTPPLATPLPIVQARIQDFLGEGAQLFSFLFAPENLKIAPAEKSLSGGGGGGAGGGGVVSTIFFFFFFFAPENLKIAPAENSLSGGGGGGGGSEHIFFFGLEKFSICTPPLSARGGAQPPKKVKNHVILHDFFLKGGGPGPPPLDPPLP